MHGFICVRARVDPNASKVIMLLLQRNIPNYFKTPHAKLQRKITFVNLDTKYCNLTLQNPQYTSVVINIFCPIREDAQQWAVHYSILE